MDIQQATDESTLLPVLGGRSSSRFEALFGMLDFAGAHLELVPDQVFVVFAMAGITPRGTIGLEWLGRGMYERMGEPPLDQVLDLAAGNLAPGLRINSYTTAEGDELFELTREGYLAASALALPGFHDRMSEVVRAERLIVGVPCGDNLYLADAAAPVAAEQVRSMTLESEHTDQYLGPSVFLVDETGISLVADRRI